MSGLSTGNFKINKIPSEVFASSRFLSDDRKLIYLFCSNQLIKFMRGSLFLSVE